MRACDAAKLPLQSPFPAVSTVLRPSLPVACTDAICGGDKPVFTGAGTTCGASSECTRDQCCGTGEQWWNAWIFL